VFPGAKILRGYFDPHTTKIRETLPFRTSPGVFDISLLEVSTESRQIFLEIFPLVLAHPRITRNCTIRFNEATIIYIANFLNLRRSIPEAIKLGQTLPSYSMTLRRLAFSFNELLPDDEVCKMILQFLNLKELLISTIDGIKNFSASEDQWLDELGASLKTTRKWTVDKQSSMWKALEK
jgi:hypothetical protein